MRGDARTGRERGGIVGGRGEPVGRQLLQRGGDRRLDLLGDAGPESAQRPRPLGHHLGHDRLRAGPGERRLAGEHLVGDRAQGVDVGPVVHRALARRLLRRHVLRGAEREAGPGHPLAAGLLDSECDAEVRDQRRAVVEQDVLRLDVAVDHAVLVCVRQRLATSPAIRTASVTGSCRSRTSRARRLSPSTYGIT